jgi:predicted RND superfamily exporter protein
MGPGERHDLIDRLSRAFERLAAWSYDHRWIVAGLSLLLAIGGGYALLFKLGVDNSFEAYFDRSDPVYSAYLRYRDDFGSDEISYLMYEAPGREHGVFDLEVMRRIASLTEALESEVPFVAEVTSLSNAEYVEAIPDGIRVYDLLEDFPATQEELLEVRRKVLAKPLYVGGIVSPDGRHGAIVLEMDKSSIDPQHELVADPAKGYDLDNLYPQATDLAIEEILARPEYAGLRFWHSGDVPLNAAYNWIIIEEGGLFGRLTLTALAVVGLLLLIFFRSPVGVIGPLAVAALSVVLSLASIWLLGWQADILSSIVPTMVIAIGVAESVHIISDFRAKRLELGDRREALRRTLFLVGPPCLMTTLTNGGGFVSMVVSPIVAISHMAVYSAIGVVASFVFSVTLLIVFLSLGRRHSRVTSASHELALAKGGERFQRGLEWVARFDLRHPRAILAGALAVCVLAVWGVTRLTVDSNFITEFGEDVPIRRDTIAIDDSMGGMGSLVYLFDSGSPDGVKDPEVLREIERLQAEAGRDPLVKKTYSIVDVLKDLNQQFHDGDPAWHVLPDSRELVAQYLLLYESSGGDETEEYVSSDYARANLELRVKLVETSKTTALVERLDGYLAQHPVQRSELEVTGIWALWFQLVEYITSSQVNGFLLAFAVIASLMALIFRSLKLGLLSMVPNVLPSLITLGMMGFVGFALDYNKLLLGTVAIGIAVDDTIHHVTRFRHEFERCGSYAEALFATMRDVGRAVFITSAALVCGFLVFLASSLDSQSQLGILLAFCISTALVAEFLLMPALILVLEPFGPEGARGALRKAA